MGCVVFDIGVLETDLTFVLALCSRRDLIRDRSGKSVSTALV